MAWLHTCTGRLGRQINGGCGEGRRLRIAPRGDRSSAPAQQRHCGQRTMMSGAQHARGHAAAGPQTAATVGDLVLEGECRLRASGVDNARLEAELLLGHAMNASRLHLHLAWRTCVRGVEADCYRALLLQRENGRPVQYVTGEAAFRDLGLKVDEGVLIPRPETETLVDLALCKYRRGEVPRGPWVDVGTGSGAIALSLVSEEPHIPMFAVELSSEALSVARRNRESLGLSGSCRLIRGSLLTPFRPGSLAAVVSNPPYVRLRNRSCLPRDVRDFEPGIALDGGVSGLRTAYELGRQAAEALATGGMLLMELGDDQPAQLARILARRNWPGAIGTHADLAGKARFLMAIKGA